MEQMGRRNFLERSLGAIGVAALAELFPGCKDYREDTQQRANAVISPKEKDIDSKKFIEKIEVKGVIFNIHFSEGLHNPPDLAVLRSAIEGAVDLNAKYIDVPTGLEISLVIRNPEELGGAGGNVPVTFQIGPNEEGRYSKPVGLEFDNKVINLSSSDITPTNLGHELLHYIRADQGIMVSHEGIEEGLAEYLEFIEGAPSEIELLNSAVSLEDFFELFPDLLAIPLEDEIRHGKAFVKDLPRKSELVAKLKREMQRRAWKKWFEKPANTDFLRNLHREQARIQKDQPQKVWTVTDFVAAGSKINPEFASWFESQKIFEMAEPGPIIRAIFKDGKIHILSLSQESLNDKAGKDISKYPKLFHLQPFEGEVKVTLSLRSGSRLNFTLPLRGKTFDSPNIKKALAERNIAYEELVSVQIKHNGQDVTLKAVP